GAPGSDRGRSTLSARTIIHQRRSAVAMDGRTTITAAQFYAMLERVLHRPDRAPWCALGDAPRVHLALMVHRVDGLAPGLYVLVRTPDGLAELQSRLQGDFDWKTPPACPAHLPLYHLLSGDARRVAGQVSCGQDIAAEGAFSLGMLAEFDRPLAELGPWCYRRLYWETGMIGQVLYLEAEAAGVRATGIGCFFDDLVHDLFGVTDRTWQSLYHFTVGGPVEDTRLTTLPPYK
ncbi:MAG TPA: SagB/ThcOx family dehydrogenase, partial [Phycisphaerae bacterium]|nr:SagB/ThcOx family dehydrogenase [Phycisphaerae bacterium]